VGRVLAIKGATMGVFGLWVLGITAWHAWHGTLPHAATMGVVGVAALVANAASFGSCGLIVVAMQTCVQPGFARAMDADGARPLRAMCGRLPVGKLKLHVALLVGAAMCSAC